MSWITDEGDHEGWAAAEFPDGRVSVGGNVGGVAVRTPEDAINGAYTTYGADPETADGRTAIGWRGLCTCGWLGPLWRRVPAEAGADPVRRLVHWARPDEWAEAPEATEDAIRAEWKAHLPSPTLGEIKSAALAVRKATNELDDAVSRARLDGATWAAIGDAAGMSRQAANERWGRRS